MRHSLRPLPWGVCVVLLAAAFIAGCGTTAEESAPLAAAKVHGPKARITVSRPQEFVNAAVAARVRVDGRQVASLSGGGSASLDVSAGPHKIVVDGWNHPNAFSITLQAKAGMLYVLEISSRSEPVAAGILFGLVGSMVEAAANENGGPFQIRIAEAKPLR